MPPFPGHPPPGMTNFDPYGSNPPPPGASQGAPYHRPIPNSAPPSNPMSAFPPPPIPIPLSNPMAPFKSHPVANHTAPFNSNSSPVPNQSALFPAPWPSGATTQPGFNMNTPPPNLPPPFLSTTANSKLTMPSMPPPNMTSYYGGSATPMSSSMPIQPYGSTSAIMDQLTSYFSAQRKVEVAYRGSSRSRSRSRSVGRRSSRDERHRSVSSDRSPRKRHKPDYRKVCECVKVFVVN